MGRAVQELRIDPSQGPRFSRRGVFEATARIIGGAAAARVIDVFDPLLAKTSLAAPFADALHVPSFDFDIAPRPGIKRGRFFAIENPNTPRDYFGYAVLDTDEVPMLSVFEEIGGADVWGPPISRMYQEPGGKRRPAQLFQKAELLLTPDGKGYVLDSEFGNTGDNLRDAGVDLDVPGFYIPAPTVQLDRERPFGHLPDGTPLPETMEEYYTDEVFGQVAQYPALLQTHRSNPRRYKQWGLPLSSRVYDNGALVVVGMQRGALQYWSDKTPWTEYPGQVVVANSGDIYRYWIQKRELYHLIPQEALQPEPNTSYGVGGGAEPPRPPEPVRPARNVETALNGRVKIDEPAQTDKQYNINEATIDKIEPLLNEFNIKNLSFLTVPTRMIGGQGIAFSDVESANAATNFNFTIHHQLRIDNINGDLRVRIWWNPNGTLSQKQRDNFANVIFPDALAMIFFYHKYGFWHDPGIKEHNHELFNKAYKFFQQSQAIQAVFP